MIGNINRVRRPKGDDMVKNWGTSGKLAVSVEIGTDMRLIGRGGWSVHLN